MGSDYACRAQFGDLAGVSVDAIVSCGKTRFDEALLFTHRGLSGPAILQASSGIFGAVAAPLGNIDKVVVIDQGSGDGASSGIGRLARAGPTVVFSLLQQLEALGLNVPSLLQQLGVHQSNGGVPPDSSVVKKTPDRTD